MKKNMNKIGIAVCILLLAIGFAAVATNLFINGTISIVPDEDDFDVIFTQSIVDNVDVSGTTISKDGKTITYETKNLSQLGDKSTLDFEVTNKSKYYDANVIMTCVGGAKDGEYYTITKTFPQRVNAQTKETGNITINLKKVSAEVIKENFKCTLIASAIERTELLDIPASCKATQGDGTNVGDKITCGTESFYVIKNDGTNIRMLAEYNLMVGSVYYNGTKVEDIANPSGMQNSEMRGATEPFEQSKGVIPYSSYEQKGATYSTYKGSIAEIHVNNYKMKLEDIGVKVKEATLITKEELNELGVIDNIGGEVPGREWLYQTTYWTRTINGTYNIWHMNTDGYLSMNARYNYDLMAGVRPVIVISASDI